MIKNKNPNLECISWYLDTLYRYLNTVYRGIWKKNESNISEYYWSVCAVCWGFQMSIHIRRAFSAIKSASCPCGSTRDIHCSSALNSAIKSASCPCGSLRDIQFSSALNIERILASTTSIWSRVVNVLGVHSVFSKEKNLVESSHNHPSKILFFSPKNAIKPKIKK